MTHKFKQTLTLQFTMLVLAFLSMPSFANSQGKAVSTTRDTLNIGFVHYTKGSSPGTLYARWNYANIWSGPGIATGGPKDGFAGRYHVRYFFENGEFSDEYDLVIEKTGDFYSVSWFVKGKLLAKGVGMETESGLSVGWRRLSD